MVAELQGVEGDRVERVAVILQDRPEGAGAVADPPGLVGLDAEPGLDVDGGHRGARDPKPDVGGLSLHDAIVAPLSRDVKAGRGPS